MTEGSDTMQSTEEYVQERLKERQACALPDGKLDKLLQERGKAHGDAETTHSIAYALFEYIDKKSPQNNLRNSSRAMMFLICVKIARGLQNPKHADHWDDIGGYAELIKRVECDGQAI